MTVSSKRVDEKYLLMRPNNFIGSNQGRLNNFSSCLTHVSLSMDRSVSLRDLLISEKRIMVTVGVPDGNLKFLVKILILIGQRSTFFGAEAFVWSDYNKNVDL